MNQPTKLRRCFSLATLLAVGCLFAGCIYPHTSERSVEVKGRVLDSQTRLPIKGAKIYFLQSPHHTTHTDAKGLFMMKARNNFHWGVNPAGGDIPMPKMDLKIIDHPNYEGINLGGRGDIGDVLLQPKQSSIP